MYVSVNSASISSGYVLWPVRRQAISWTNLNLAYYCRVTSISQSRNLIYGLYFCEMDP